MREPAQPRDRPDPGRRRVPAGHAAFRRGRRQCADAGRRRQVPYLRRSRQRHGVGRGRRGAGAQAARRGPRRRRPDPRRDRGQRHQPGRRHQRHHGAERARAAAVADRRVCALRHRSGRHPVRRGARHRYLARRSDRDARADRRVSSPYRAPRLLRDRIGQDQCRPHRHGGRRDRRREGADGDAASAAARLAELRGAESPYRFRDESVLRQYRGAAVDARARRRASRGGQFVRLQRHQCPPGAGEPPRCARGARGCRRAATAGAVGTHARAVARPCRARGRLARRQSGLRSRGRRLHPADGPRGYVATCCAGGARCRRRRASIGAMGAAGRRRRRRPRAAARPGEATGRRARCAGGAGPARRDGP